MTNPMKYILFEVGEQTFAVDVLQIMSIERLQPITAVPKTSDFIKGVTEIRGETTAIIDLKERLHMIPVEHTDDTRILVIALDDVQVGLIVDAATEVKDIDPAFVEAAPSLVAGVKDTFLTGVAKIDDSLILILDVEKVLDLEETNEIKDVLEED